MSPLKNKNPLTRVEIDKDALRGNIRVIQKIAGRVSAEVLAVVKADAYGHGMVEVSKVLHREGVRFFGVANIDEAAALRKAIGEKVRILTLGSFCAEQVHLYLKYRIIPTISSEEDLWVFSKQIPKTSRYPVHLKIDTGMGRLGTLPDEASFLFRACLATPRIEVEGIYTHFSSADDPSRIPTDEQVRLFEKTLQSARNLGIYPRYVHAANSMGLMRFRSLRFNLVRPGIVLYGLKPSASCKLPKGIWPILSLKTCISFLKKLKKGMTVSYGRTHTVGKDTLVATLPIGYSHGYRRALSNKAYVLVRGVRCPVLGRVTMDECMVDVGKVRGVRRWDEVVLIGRSGRERIRTEDLARLSDTIPYEITCGIHPKVFRVYTT